MTTNVVATVPVVELSSTVIGVYGLMHIPNIESQRAAMQKLAFLIGDWSREASVLRRSGQFVDLAQTEHAQFSLSFCKASASRAKPEVITVLINQAVAARTSVPPPNVVMTSCQLIAITKPTTPVMGGPQPR